MKRGSDHVEHGTKRDGASPAQTVSEPDAAEGSEETTQRI